MKVPLEEQIGACELALRTAGYRNFDGLNAAINTLKWVERHQAELRVLGEFPIETVTVREAEE